MQAELQSVHEHMRRLGLGALAHANWHANYFSHDNPCWSELSVLQAAHAAEVLMKARIAQEHPLLIFEHLPKDKALTDPTLALDHLIEKRQNLSVERIARPSLGDHRNTDFKHRKISKLWKIAKHNPAFYSTKNRLLGRNNKIHFRSYRPIHF